MFCHANNLFWTLEQIDAEAVEAPKVPSGMTGGVEYEAMAYCVSPPMTTKPVLWADDYRGCRRRISA